MDPERLQAAATSGSASVFTRAYWVNSAFGWATSGSLGQTPEYYQDQCEQIRRQRQALERSRVLFEEFLTPEQQLELANTDSVTIRSQGGLLYRIKTGYSQNVFALDWLGRAVRKFCLTVVGQIPVYDQMLSQMLMLQNEEAEFLKVANSWDMGPRGD